MEYVYLLQELDFGRTAPTGSYKIGMTSKDVDSRKRQYKAGNPRHLRTLHSIQVTDAQAVETELHRQLAEWRINEGGGDEWFYFTDADIDVVIDIMNSYDESLVYEIPVYDSSAYFTESPYDAYPSYSNDWADSVYATGIAIVVVVGLMVGGIALVLNQSLPSTPAPARITVPAGTGYAGANLRSEPKDGDEFIIGQVRSGESVKAYEVSFDGKWRRVELSDGRSGWIASNFVR
ncbi:GIY-YIG nuclease family protein [Leptolyngbya ohadii]|uniref:GIY-YIG nuclease family protein n=1 Tax=Leptolyngbya ohadii TaxID=1962290 RepID=UPI000B59B464|nr:GIY-YIG nuclease family protein [Leptolyngbya ohadii]